MTSPPPVYVDIRILPKFHDFCRKKNVFFFIDTIYALYVAKIVMHDFHDFYVMNNEHIFGEICLRRQVHAPLCLRSLWMPLRIKEVLCIYLMPIETCQSGPAL